MKTKFIGPLTNVPGVVPVIIAIAICIACNATNQMRTQKKSTTKPNDSVLVDRAGNKYSIKILLDDNLWITTNLKLNIPNSYCYENATQNCELYGRLYTWESAKQGCRLLGEGWGLPTKDEWQRLAGFYGDIVKDSVENRKRAYQSLLNTGNSQFNAVLGGGRAPDSQYSRLDAHGFYWTATESDSSTAWFYNFAKGSQALYQQTDGEKTRAFSVRCLNRVDSLKLK